MPEHVRTLSYFGVVNFARHITCPVLDDGRYGASPQGGILQHLR